MKNHFHKYLSLFLVLLISACNSDNGTTPTEDETNGPISGNVYLFTNKGISQLNSGMTISLEGTSFTTESDAQGFYNFPSVPFGDYSLKYEKDGFGTYYQEVEHNKGFSVNGTVLLDLYLGQIASSISIQVSTEVKDQEFDINLTTSPSGSGTNPVYVTVFFGTDNAVSNFSNQGVKYRVGLSSGTGQETITVTFAQLLNMGFSSGDTVYFRVYGDSYHPNDYQGEFGRVHPNVNQPGTNVLTVQIP